MPSSPSAKPNQANAGGFIVKALEAYGSDRLFCVPGESFLPLLDALQDSTIHTVLARHEGGAAIMAEADAKLTHRPGVVAVTRGPGATNASAGVHIAQQDSTPLLLLVGQVARAMRGRDAFQEVDYESFFGGMAKYVTEIHDPNTLPNEMQKAMHIATSGRPGPVVISLPEDMLYDALTNDDVLPLSAPEVAVATAADIAKLADLIGKASTPIIIAGGPNWTEDGQAALDRLGRVADVPITCSFRRQGIVHAKSPVYAGDLGRGCNPKLLARIKESDLVIVFGGRLSEIPAQGYNLIDIPKPQMPLVHIHRDSHEIGRVYQPTLGIVGDENRVAVGLAEALAKTAAKTTPRIEAAHADYTAWATPFADEPGSGVSVSRLVGWLREHLPDNAIITNGAGNYGTWVHRFYHYRHLTSQLAPIAGSMGYGLPAGIAAGLRHPDRPVVAFAGDGCFQTNMQELATARQENAKLVVLVIDNGMYGTIRMHQEQHFPGRGGLTSLHNPDFAGLATSMGWTAFRVETDAEFPPAMQKALAASKSGPALIHVRADPEAISPGVALSKIATG